MVFNNPFEFYSGKEDIEKSKKATKEIKKEWKEFCGKIKGIQTEYIKVGADDTASRDALIEWVKKNIGDLF